MFICGEATAGTCTYPGCWEQRNTVRCEFPLRGAKAGQPCGKAVCPAHAAETDGSTRCASHARLEAGEKKDGRRA